MKVGDLWVHYPKADVFLTSEFLTVMGHLRLTQEAASSSPAVPAMPKSPENALEFPQDAAVARQCPGNHRRKDNHDVPLVLRQRMGGDFVRVASRICRRYDTCLSHRWSGKSQTYTARRPLTVDKLESFVLCHGVALTSLYSVRWRSYAA
jgi:hypothetical protein